MHDRHKYTKTSPRLTANIISRLFFWWLKDLLIFGYKHDIVASDLYEVLPQHRSEVLCDNLEKVWIEELKNAESNKKKPSLWKAIIKTYVSSFFKYSMLSACYIAATILMPLVLEQLLLNIDTSWSYVYATALLLLQIGPLIGSRYSFRKLLQLGMCARVALTSLMYRKIIRLSPSSVNSNTSGMITNLMSTDLQNFEHTCNLLSFSIFAPIEVLVTAYVLQRYVGYAAYVAVTLMILQILPVQALFYKWMSKLQVKQTARTDQRISLISEVLDGIHTIKMFVWEKSFEKLVCLYRRREIQIYRKMFIIPALTNAIRECGPRLNVFATILVYILLYGKIEAITILLLTQYMMNMREALMIYFADSVKFSALVNVSMKRIEKFLLLDEIDLNTERTNSMDTCVALKKVMMPKSSQYFDIDFTTNKLYFIVGPVGAGKTTLLNVILGEIQPSSGEVLVSGKVSYASQQPWLFAASIRENIIFGEEFNKDKYRTVTQACALIEDFSQLPYGDKTLVGERGLNLSGGQRARVNLARAIYRNADIYLLDDILSGIDLHVAKQIFYNCINGYLRCKTRILVTNNFQFLKEADEIILLNDGKVEFKGTPTDLYENNDYCNYLPSIADTKRSISNKKFDSNKSDKLNALLDLQADHNNADEQPKETEELLAKGYIKKSVYLRFIQAAGSKIMLISVILGFLIAVSSISAFDYWQITWRKNEGKTVNNLRNTSNEANIGNNQYMHSLYIGTSLSVCGGLLIIIIVTTLIKNLLFFKIFMNACEKMHNRMFESLIKTPLRFFHMNPSGRILNRFSNDTGSVDYILASKLFVFLDLLATSIALFISVLIVNWWNAFPAMILICFAYKFSKFYTPTSQAIKRLEGNAKSPVLSLAVTSILGLSTIRSAQSQNVVCKIFDSLQNHHTAAYYLMVETSTGFTLWLEIAILLLWGVIAFSSIMFKSNHSSSVSAVGLVLVQFRIISKFFGHLLRLINEVINQMASVERILQFVDLENEPAAEGENPVKLSKEWPDRGEITFDRVSMGYSDDAEPVLKNLYFKIEPGMKVGIVGRTGAGKSSLIAALFRLAKFDGSLLIDGIDTKTIRLSDLRSRITIIPQEPILFSSSLRDNLDPGREFSDASLWSALEHVDLKKAFKSLDCWIDRGGGNLSAGERQLLCLARAILKKNRILVMDEATANIDPATDELIQKTIRVIFENCTVLTIAHRIETVIDYDKVLVMDNGEAVEFDHPHNLLQEINSHFFKIVRQTADSKSRDLKLIVEQKSEGLVIKDKIKSN